MMLGNNLLILVLVAVAALIIRLIFTRKFSMEANKGASFIWFKEMDCVKYGARYQGDRSEIVAENGYNKLSVGSYVFNYTCETKSGRVFYIMITTSMGLVTNWDLAPIDRPEIMEATDPQ